MRPKRKPYHILSTLFQVLQICHSMIEILTNVRTKTTCKAQYELCSYLINQIICLLLYFIII
jgi:hypothetical protein